MLWWQLRLRSAIQDGFQQHVEPICATTRALDELHEIAEECYKAAAQVLLCMAVHAHVVNVHGSACNMCMHVCAHAAGGICM